MTKKKRSFPKFVFRESGLATSSVAAISPALGDYFGHVEAPGGMRIALLAGLLGALAFLLVYWFRPRRMLFLTCLSGLVVFSLGYALLYVTLYKTAAPILPDHNLLVQFAYLVGYAIGIAGLTLFFAAGYERVVVRKQTLYALASRMDENQWATTETLVRCLVGVDADLNLPETKQNPNSALALVGTLFHQGVPAP